MTSNEIRGKILSWDFTFRRYMLSRMHMDCEYFLGYGERYEKYLWAKNVEDQIEYMKEIWYSLPNEEKPEGMTFDDILEYEKRMK